jgi:hypothetical protein
MGEVSRGGDILQSRSQNSHLLRSLLCSSNHPNPQVANQEVKVATLRNIATSAEVIAVGLSGAFMFFQLLGTIGNFELAELFGQYFRNKLADSSAVV